MDKLQIAILVTLGLIACAVLAGLGGAAYYLMQSPATPTPGPSPTPLVYEFTGEGDKVIIFDSPASGLALFGTFHRGKRNFIVQLTRGNGEFVDLITNDVGNYDGETSVRIDKGQYVLNITADGQWLVVILPPQ